MKRVTVVQFKILKNLQNPPHNRIKPSVVLCVYSVYLCVMIFFKESHDNKIVTLCVRTFFY